MAKNGLLIRYDHCIGCHACEIACKQEHHLPPGKWGIKVTEFQLTADKPYLVYLPFPTRVCDLCEKRVKAGKQPSCVQHCCSGCIDFGPIDKLVERLIERPSTVLWAPR